MRLSSIARFVVGLVTVVSGFAHGGDLDVPRPPGIGIRTTVQGPVFVDSRGMTLYRLERPCTGDLQAMIKPTIALEGEIEFRALIERSRSCLEEYPILSAPADADPIGKWSVMTNENGAKQWAYDGKPLHTSIKDRAPGEVNASYPTRFSRPYPVAPAFAPLAGFPAGVIAVETARGLALADHDGHVLYHREGRDGADCSGDCLQTWPVFSVPALADWESPQERGHALSASKWNLRSRLHEDWSIVSRPDGVRQWAYGGRPLHTYRGDAAAHGEQVFPDTFGSTWGQPRDGWKVASLTDAPGYPAAVTVQVLPGEKELQSFGLPQRVFADADGRTLYTMHCLEATEDELDCDDPADDPRYWLSFCGGEDRCARTWRALPAPADAGPIGGIWSVIAIDARHPWRKLQNGEGTRVWAYRGRPVFTYANDRVPGDYYGDDHGWGTTGHGRMQARAVPAYSHMVPGAPVLTLVGEREAPVSSPKPPEQVIEDRIAAFREVGTAFKNISDELKSGEPDRTRIRDSAALIRDYSGQARNWFPPGSEPPPVAKKSWSEWFGDWLFAADALDPDAGAVESHAKMAIWTERARFDEALRRFEVEAGKMWDAAQAGDVASLTAQRRSLAEACDACHERFREELD